MFTYPSIINKKTGDKSVDPPPVDSNHLLYNQFTTLLRRWKYYTLESGMSERKVVVLLIERSREFFEIPARLFRAGSRT